MGSYKEYMSMAGESSEEVLVGADILFQISQGVRLAMPEPDSPPPAVMAAMAVVVIPERRLTWPVRRRRSRSITMAGIQAARRRAVEGKAMVELQPIAIPPPPPVGAGNGEKPVRTSPSTPLEFNRGDGASTSDGSGASTGGVKVMGSICPGKRPRSAAATESKMMVVLPLISQTQGPRPRSERPKKKTRLLELQEEVKSLMEENHRMRMEIDPLLRKHEALLAENRKLKHAAPDTTSSMMMAPEINQQPPEEAFPLVELSSSAPETNRQLPEEASTPQVEVALSSSLPETNHQPPEEASAQVVALSSSLPETNHQPPEEASAQVVASSSLAHFHGGRLNFDLNFTPEELGMAF